jgi:hypothetical protein
VVLACVVMVAAMVASHQLTPFALLVTLLAMVAARRTTARLLPLITGVLLVGWLGFLAVQYLDGHLAQLWQDALSLGTSVSTNVGERVSGSGQHLQIVYLRLAATGVLWSLAVLGVVRMMRRGRVAPSHALMAFAPLVLVVLQPYGGEVLLRSYLLALPFLAVLAAASLFPELETAWSWRRSAGLLLVLCTLMATLMYTRYGNERAYLYSDADRDAVTYLYETAAPGDLVAAGSPNVPWQDQRYSELDHEVLSSIIEPPAGPESPRALADRVAGVLQDRAGDGHAFLLITESQRSFEHMLGSSDWGTVRDVEEGALQSSRWQVVHREPSAIVFQVVESP